MSVGVLIAVLALAIGFVAILKVPRKLFAPVADPELEARLEGFEQQIADLRRELEETQERLDFAERRLLGKGE